jgi:5-methylcytosine-specific restriction endonuclease McrA
MNKPNTLFFEDEYIKHLTSPEWKRFRQRALRYYSNKCMLCGSILNLTLHHNTYERMGKERLTDVVVLCKSCHGAWHYRDKRKK